MNVWLGDDKEFPIRLELNSGRSELLTYKASIELKNHLTKEIEELEMLKEESKQPNKEGRWK